MRTLTKIASTIAIATSFSVAAALPASALSWRESPNSTISCGGAWSSTYKLYKNHNSVTRYYVIKKINYYPNGTRWVNLNVFEAKERLTGGWKVGEYLGGTATASCRGSNG